jgi:hypothetical protein
VNYDYGNGCIFGESRDDGLTLPQEGDGNAINQILDYDEIAPIMEQDSAW